ncbi:MAG: DUF6893 family small protein [Geodermatophilaceae bacterium]
MAVIGKLTTWVLLAAAAGAAVTGVRSIPDVQRYLKIRSM